MSLLERTQHIIFDRHGVHIKHKTIYQVLVFLLLSFILMIFIVLKPEPVEYKYIESSDPVANSH